MIVVDCSTWAFADPSIRDQWLRIVLVDTDPDHPAASVWRVWLIGRDQKTKEIMRTTPARHAIRHVRAHGDLKLVAHAFYLLAKEGATDVA